MKERNISGCLYGRSVLHLYLGPFDYEPSDPTVPPTKDVKTIMDPQMAALKTQLCLPLLQHGIATLGGRFFVLSAAHTKEDIGQTVEAFGKALDGLVAEGGVPKVD
ncbi:unnamed protein product [marine sediment metagenome]|uniref:Glutamate-1-semialdehyde 2,1-aminomutase n=1 Tax=marine sediment metagenome TaxID=412755 RepID=X1MEQ9_9ZZZZ